MPAEPLTHAAYVAANRDAWDQSAPLHREGAWWRELAEGFQTPGYSCLDATITGLLGDVGTTGKTVAQLGCNNARELLSVKNLGAGRCVGFDQSSAFLAQGRELAAIAGQTVELVESDIYAIAPEFDGRFDLVLVTIGVLNWMPDIVGFFEVAARLLAPDGALLVHDQHPIVNMFEPTAPDPFALRCSYFAKEPFAENQAVVYDGQPAGPVATHYWFVHTLADTLTAVLHAGLRIETFREYPDNISSIEFDVYESRPDIALPQSYALIARKS